jgi:hypothetical protein
VSGDLAGNGNVEIAEETDASSPRRGKEKTRERGVGRSGGSNRTLTSLSFKPQHVVVAVDEILNFTARCLKRHLGIGELGAERRDFALDLT